MIGHLMKRNNPLNLFDETFDAFKNIFCCNPFEVDIVEKDDQIELKANVAGANVDELNVSIENEILTISVARNEEQEDVNYYRRERHTGRLQRSFRIPGTKQNSVKASLVNGLLTVSMNRGDDCQNKKIEITTE